MQNYSCSMNQKCMVIFVTIIDKIGLESRLENMEENKVLVTELPLPFDEKDLEELKSEKCIIDYRGGGKLVVKDGQLALSYDDYWWENSKEK